MEWRADVKEERPMVHIRLPRDLLREIDHQSVDLDLDRARTIELLLKEALRARQNKLAAVS
jgi:hypothetical protein